MLASRLRIPALIVLLPVGFAAGALTSDVNPDKLLGPAFQPMVSLAVAVILYDAGLGLDLRKLTGHPRRVAWRLIALGVPITIALATCMALALLLLGMPEQAALMTGAILVVSGPTVVGPLLAFVRPSERVQRILAWEGSLIDPVGAILGAVIFHGIVTHTAPATDGQLGQFLASIGVGAVGGAVGIALLVLVLRVLRLGEVLGSAAQLACVIGVAAACDVLRDDTGLIAAILMGLAAANLRGFDIPAPRPFFETLVQLIIGLLFISISATVTPSSIRHLILPTMGLVAVLVLVARPLVAWAATLRTDLTRGERGFIGWMAPRRDHRRRHRVDVRACAVRCARRRRAEDPAGHVPRDRADGDALQPHRGTGRRAARRHPPGADAAAPCRRRSLGDRARHGSSVSRIGGAHVGRSRNAAQPDQTGGARTGARGNSSRPRPAAVRCSRESRWFSCSPARMTLTRSPR